jgi:hypothetical protein
MPATKGGVIYGQDVFFLGFPYDLLSNFFLGEHGYPLPLIKKGIVSLFQSDEVFLLDGRSVPRAGRSAPRLRARSRSAAGSG